MIRDFLRAILCPTAIVTRSEDDGRIAGLQARIAKLEIMQETLMARSDELVHLVLEIGAFVDAVAVHVNDLSARLSVAGAEDPRVGEAADALVAIKGKLAAILPPAPEPEVAAG